MMDSVIKSWYHTSQLDETNSVYAEIGYKPQNPSKV